MTSEIDWVKIREKLPTEKTDEQREKRAELFSKFDPNGNGYLSLAEVDKGVSDVLEIQEIFDCKPVIQRAFQAAKGVHNSKNKTGDDYIERIEFRLLLVYLRQYFEIWTMFIDVMGDDRKISYEEFENALPKFQEWGAKIDDPKTEFEAIDGNDGGSLLFNEFADWALKKKLDLEDDDD